MGEVDARENEPLLTNKNSATDGEPASSYGTSQPEDETVKPSTGDEESSEREDEDNQMFVGLPEVKKRLKYIVPAVGIGVFLSAADQTLVVASYGRIGSDLNSLNNTSWIATAYFLTLTSIQPLYGKLSDIFGRKSCLLFAYTIFGVGCLFCGLARNMNELIAARAFAGIGGGGMTTVVAIMMSDIVTLRERGMWQGILNLIYAAGAGCGAPLGGLVTDALSWRWAFLIQAPLCAAAIVAVAVALNLPRKEISDWKTKFRRVDFLGAIVLIAAVFNLIFGMDRGANVGWKSPAALVPLCLSFPLVVLFLIVESKIAVEPFAPKHIMFERTLFACYLCNFFSFASYMGFIFFLPLYYQAVDKTSASQAGVRLLPGVVASVSGSMTAGIIMKKTGKYYWLTIVAYALLTLGYIPVLLFSGVIMNSIVGISIGLAFIGLGGGTGVTTVLTATLAAATSQDQAVATACSYLFRSTGSVIGMSVSASMVQQSLKTQLRERLKHGKDAEFIERKVRESLEFIETLDPKIQEIVRECYGRSTRQSFIFMMCLGFMALVSCLFIREKNLSR